MSADLLAQHAKLDALAVPAESDETVVEVDVGRKTVIWVVGEAGLTAKQSIDRDLAAIATAANALDDGREGIGIDTFIERKPDRSAFPGLSARNVACSVGASV